MRKLSIRKIIAKIILLIVFLCMTGGCLLLGIKVRQMVCDHVFVLSFQQENQKFRESDIAGAENNGICLTYIKRLYPEVSNGFRTEEAEVLATNDNYIHFSGLELVEGCFFNQKQTENKLSVAVLNEAAACLLFGNQDCIGESIYLDQNDFVVIGIVKEAGNEETARIYVSDKVAEGLGISCLEVNQLWCQFDNVAEAAMLIQTMGYRMEEIEIVQMDLYKNVFMRRFLMIPILAGVVLFLITLKETLKKAKMIAQKGTKDRKYLTKFVSELLICAVSFLLTGKMIQLFWCVPPNYELIGKNFRDGFYTVLEFYFLFDVELDNMYILNEWNLLSMLLFVGSVLIFGMWLAGKLGRHYGYKSRKLI